MKKVLIVNQNSGYLTIDIANAFANEYDEVVLLAGLVKPMERELFKKVKINKIIQYNRETSIKRIFTWIYGSLQIFILILTKYKKFEVIYFTNPPMAYCFQIFLTNKFSLVIYDTYPDALETIGVNKSNFFYKYWVKINNKVFNKATKIITLSNGMADQLTQYVARGRVVSISNWSGSDDFKPVSKNVNKFIADNHLNNKFIIMYSGNMGYTHNVEIIIELAIALQTNENIHFLLIGEGQKKEQLLNLTKQNNLNNITFKTWQPVDILPFSLAAADISIITLDDKASNLSVPSKAYNLLAVGSPILAIASHTSELAQLLESYGNGKCFEKNNLDGMIKFINELAENPEIKYSFSEKSMNASKHFTKENAKLYL
jgi:glycosyltransferase involved in cell wall biosynthesis